ncbi:adenosine deaminase [bacterium]|nr:adenosine deaminase [bacterium]
MNIDREWLTRLPKTDLHVHLDGSLRPLTLLELAAAQGVELPATNERELRALTQVQGEERSLSHYLRAFMYTLPVLQTAPALERVAYELALDAAAENVRLIEVRYSPLLHRERGLHNREIIEAVARGLRRAEAETGILTGQILCGIRSMTPERSLELAQATLLYKDLGIVAFDLAGEEKDYPAKQHREAFYFVLNHNLNSTLHAGEAFGPESIAQALHYCGTHRIGHGTRLFESPELMNYVNDHRIPLEMCLTSNVHTGAVSSLQDHPCRKYLELGLRVTLNTDNRLISDTSVTLEFERATRAFALTVGDIHELILNGFKSAFLPHRQKAALMRQVVEELESLGVPPHHAYTNGRGDHL